MFITMKRQNELLQYASFEYREQFHYDPGKRLSRDAIEYFEESERNHFANTCYTTAWAWRSI